ncbi:MAG: hypothetical protein ACLQVF_22865 [Isosphaeraceae bacterium]
MDRDDLIDRARQYAARQGLGLLGLLGAGIDGSVFAAECQAKGGRSAVKGHVREVGYCRERDAYLRLRECGVTTIRGCNVPALIDFDDDLWCIEMTVVSRPFLLDFAGANLDEPPDFSPEVLSDWQAKKAEQFGADLPEVEAILGALERFGIYMLDVNPGNVSFDD